MWRDEENFYGKNYDTKTTFRDYNYEFASFGGHLSFLYMTLVF